MVCGKAEVIRKIAYSTTPKDSQGRQKTFGLGSRTVFWVGKRRNVPPEIPLDTPSSMRDREWRFQAAVEAVHTGLQHISVAVWPKARRGADLGQFVTNGSYRLWIQSLLRVSAWLGCPIRLSMSFLKADSFFASRARNFFGALFFLRKTVNGPGCVKNCGAIRAGYTILRVSGYC